MFSKRRPGFVGRDAVSGGGGGELSMRCSANHADSVHGLSSDQRASRASALRRAAIGSAGLAIMLGGSALASDALRGQVVSRHVLKPNTRDDDATIVAWADELNRDCGDHVIGEILAGRLTLRREPFIQIKSACRNPRRTVEILGHGIDSTAIHVMSS